jgi:hypothetical protein
MGVAGTGRTGGWKIQKKNRRWSWNGDGMEMEMGDG